jgi:hypothetical protein
LLVPELVRLPTVAPTAGAVAKEQLPYKLKVSAVGSSVGVVEQFGVKKPWSTLTVRLWSAIGEPPSPATP